MNKSTKTEAGTPPPAPQTKRYDDEFKRQAVEMLGRPCSS